jgi:hypothetical protein
MTNSNDGVDTEKLRDLYRSDSTARALFNHFASSTKNMTKSTVDRLHAVLSDANPDFTRTDIIRVLRRLAELNCGDFMTGRKGHPSRMIWKVGIVSMAQAASGKPSTIETIIEENGEDAPIQFPTTSVTMMTVGYPLRADMSIEVVLPKNLTSREASRFAEFIKTLPFGDEAAAS